MAGSNRASPGARVRSFSFVGSGFDRYKDRVFRIAQSTGNHIRAGANGFGDSITMGLGDPYLALDAALKHQVLGRTMADRYHTVREAQRAQDRYDEQHFKTARRTGQVGGAVVGIAATGGVGGVSVGARLAPQAARLTAITQIPRVFGPPAAAAGVGASSSVAGQAIGDVASRRMSAPRVYGTAALGGATGGATTLYRGPKAGAVVDAAMTESALAALEGRQPSLETIERSALAGTYLAHLGQLQGSRWADGLTFKKKGRLGEAMSVLKTLSYGERPILGRPERKYLSDGKYTYPDPATTEHVVVESKLRRDPDDLSPNQMQAWAELGPEGYRVDDWRAGDFGKGVGGVLGIFGARLPARTDDRGRR